MANFHKVMLTIASALIAASIATLPPRPRPTKHWLFVAREAPIAMR
jgi:hypothetical protein